METVYIVGALVLGAVILYFLFGTQTDTSGAIVLVAGSQNGDMEKSTSLELPRSFNQPQGLTFTYSAWVLIKDFTAGYGNRRRIFSKGDCPGLYIDSTSNSFVVSMDTYGAKETILIPNIPAMKWIHIAIVVDQNSVDIYINGILRQHHSLAQLPKQNEEPVLQGPGWDGVLARLKYYPRALNHVEIKEQSQEPVPDDLQGKISGPQYFDMSWYIGRLYSK